MKKEVRLISISTSVTILVLSMLSFAQPVNAISMWRGAQPAVGTVGSTTLLQVTEASPGGQVQTYWENLAGQVLGDNSTYADATGAVNIWITIPDATGGLHSLIVRDLAIGGTAGATYTVTPSTTLSSTHAHPGEHVSVDGFGFPASKNITITVNGIDCTEAIITSGVTGNFSGSFVVPDLTLGDYPVVATDNSTIPWDSPAVTFTIQEIVFDATINALDVEGWLAEPIWMDGMSTGWSTSHTFTNLHEAHGFSVPSTDSRGYPFVNWNTGETNTTILVYSDGVYVARYAPPLTVSVTPNSSIMVIADSTVFTATASGGWGPMVSYEWYVDGELQSNGTASTFDYVPDTDGTHSITVTVTDNLGITSPQSVPASVTVNPVIPEFASYLFLPFLMLATISAIALNKRKH